MTNILHAYEVASRQHHNQGKTSISFNRNTSLETQ
jgi:hypothetical protein